MVAADFTDDDIRVVKFTELTRQTIRLDTQESAAATIEKMLRLMRVGKFTGHIRITVNQGGIRSIDTEQETRLVKGFLDTIKA